MPAPVIYQLQLQVAPEAERSWDAWYTGEHVPDVLRRSCFSRAVIYRAEPGGTAGWPEYVIQYEAPSRAALEAYLAGDAAVALRREHEERFGEVTRISRRILAPLQQLGRD
jgi:hypothetical protein